MSVTLNDWRAAAAPGLALLLLPVLTSCTVVRVVDYSKYRFTRDQAALLDAADERAGGLHDDPHRACLHWQEVGRKVGVDDSRRPLGFVEYVEKKTSRACRHEQRLAAATSALERAQQSPSDRDAQRLALERVVEFAAAQGTAATRAENLTLRELLAEADPVVARMEDGQPSCADLLVVSNLLWTVGAQQDALSRYLGPQRPCLGAKEVSRAATALRRENRCEDVVALAAEVWPRMEGRDDQVLILDLVMDCSDEYTMRRNYSFVPPEVLVDYEALLRRRAADRAEAQWQQERSRAVERCEDDCLTMYADNGVCMSSCAGDSICVKNCRALGNTCRNSCVY